MLRHDTHNTYYKALLTENRLIWKCDVFLRGIRGNRTPCDLKASQRKKSRDKLSTLQLLQERILGPYQTTELQKRTFNAFK